MRVAALGLALMFAAGLPGLARAQDGARDAVPEAPSVELRPATVRFRASLEGVHVLYMQDPVLEDSPRGLAVRGSPPYPAGPPAPSAAASSRTDS